MNKQTKWIVATLAAMAMATPAFALQAETKGYLNVRGVAQSNFDGDDSVRDHVRGIDQRLRLWTHAAASEDVKAVFAMEVDNTWGDTGSGGKEVGRLAADAKGQIEIKQAYLDFNVAGMNVKAGTQYNKLAGGLLLGEDATGIFATKKMGDNSLNAIWIKIAEGSATIDNADSDYYSLKYNMKAGDMSISPFVGYLDGAGAAEPVDIYLGTDFSGKAGEIGLSGSLVVDSWDAGNGNDGLGIAAKAKATMDIFSLEFGYYGDEDNGGNFRSVLAYNNFAEILTGGKYDNRGTVARDGGGMSAYVMNFMYLKAGASMKLDDKSKVSGYIMHVEQAADTAIEAYALGQEIDLYYDYTITKGLTFNATAAYLLNDKIGAGDDMFELGTGLTYSF